MKYTASIVDAMKGSKIWQKLKIGIGCGFLASSITLPASAAERIIFNYPPFGDFHISVKSLEIFAKEGKVTDDLSTYTQYIGAEQMVAFRDVLNTRFKVSHVTVSQFTYSPVGETILQRLGQILKGEPNFNGFYALRSSFILSAMDPQGMNIINVLKRFPLDTMRIDLTLTLQLAGEVSQLFYESNLIVQRIRAIALADGTAEANTAMTTLATDLRQAGMVPWQKTSFTVNVPYRDSPVPVDVYLPRANSQPVPVIIISHGLASNRSTFAYLAAHLASYGFAVAVVEHVGTSSQSIEKFFSGLGSIPDEKTWVDRPLDIKYVLDDLEQRNKNDPTWQGRLNLNDVGIVGQSLGGYTALAVAGAPINFPLLDQECSKLEPRNLSLNLSLALQCQASALPATSGDLRDPRIKAAIAVNPLSSKIFGQSSLNRIQIPVAIVASSEDYFAPAVAEQIYPFTWLTTPVKYLLVLEGGTHFSFLPEEIRGGFSVPDSLIGPDTKVARSYLQSFSTAFFKTYLSNEPQYQPYLTASYFNGIASDSFQLSLIKSLTTNQIQQALKPTK